MKDYYYLEVNYQMIDGRKKVNSYDLYNKDEYIKTYKGDQAKYITKKSKELGIRPKDRRNDVFFDDEYFIRYIERSLNPPKKRTVVNKKMVGVFIGLSLLTVLGTVKFKNKSDTLSTSNPIVEASELNDDYLDTETIKVEDNTETTEGKEISTSSTEDEVPDVNFDEIDSTMYLENVDNEKLIDNGFENIFEFSYEDRSTSNNVSIVNDNYSYLIDTYSNKYGIDPKLMTAIICQENPTNQKNYSMVAGHGVSQIESIHNGSEIYAFNFETNQNESSGPIDVLRCTDDQEYSIKLACMIMNNQYNYIHEKYGFKLTKEQELTATVWSYNKGITSIITALNNTDTYEEFVDYVKYNSVGGDNEYIEHVFSYLPDQEIITMKTRDGLLNSVMIDNTTIENVKKPITL